MITKLAGYYSIGGNPVIVDDGLEVSFSDDKEFTQKSEQKVSGSGAEGEWQGRGR